MRIASTLGKLSGRRHGVAAEGTTLGSGVDGEVYAREI
jgi:hypothetical protein